MAESTVVGRPRGPAGVAGRMVSVLASLLTLVALAWAADLFQRVGVQIYTEQFLAGMLAIAFPLLYLKVRISPAVPPETVPWYDWVLALVGAAAAIYTSIRYPVLAERLSATPNDGVLVAAIMLTLLVEGLRRTVGLVLTVLAVTFFLIGGLGHLVSGSLAARPVPWDMLSYYLAWDPNGILGLPMVVVTTIVTAFVFFGQVLMKAGGSEFFTDFSMILVGRFRGGQAKIAVTASGLFGSISGSAVSNVVTTGVITIPLMRSAGYKTEHAGAIEAVASTGGQLMPPVMGAAAFLMAEFLEIPYTDVVIAALLPALLYYAALFILADLEAAKTGIMRIPEEKIPKTGPVFRGGWFFPIPFVVLIASLFWWNYTPQASALLAAATVGGCAMVFGYRGRRLTWLDVLQAVRDTGTAVLDILMIGGAAGIVIGVLNISGIGFGLTLALVEVGSGNLPLLLVLSALVCIVLGMGMPTVGVYLVLATLVAPSLVEVGVTPIAAHLFILYFGMMSMITPPVAIAAFAAATLSGGDAMKTGFAAMRFGWLAYVIPFLFVASPVLLLQGKPLETVVAIVTALAGVWLVSAGVTGYLFRPMGAGSRVLVAIAGLLLLFPAGAIKGGGITDLAGLALGVLVVGRDLLGARRSARASTAPA